MAKGHCRVTSQISVRVQAELKASGPLSMLRWGRRSQILAKVSSTSAVDLTRAVVCVLAAVGLTRAVATCVPAVGIAAAIMRPIAAVADTTVVAGVAAAIM